MADLRPAAQRGFTLIEMMVAMAILLVGVTSLLSALGGGVDLRRAGEAQIQAGLCADEAFLQVQQGIQLRQDATSPLDLQLPVLQDQPLGDFPGMSYTVRYHEDAGRPDVVLVEIAVRWQEQAEDVQQQFFRVLRKQSPAALRVKRFRQDNGLQR